MPNDDTVKMWTAALALVAAALALAGCGTTHATIETSRGEQLMLLGPDPVAYFTEKRPVRGRHTLPALARGPNLLLLFGREP